MSNHPNVLVITLNATKRAKSQSEAPAAEPLADTSNAPAPEPASDDLARVLAAYQEHNQYLTEEGVELNGKLIDATLENDRLRKLLKDVAAGARQDRDTAERLRQEVPSVDSAKDETRLLRSTQLTLAQTEADLAATRRLLQEATLRNEAALSALRTGTQDA